MASLNKVMLIGNLGADPEIRTTQAGAKVATFRVATSENWKDKATGERRERTEWHTVVVFNDGLVGIAERFLKKGSRLYVEGQLQTRKWQDQAGADRWSTEVVLQAFRGQMILLDRAEGGSGDRYAGHDYRGGGGGTGGGGTAGGAAGAAQGRDDFLDDDVPF